MASPTFRSCAGENATCEESPRSGSDGIAYAETAAPRRADGLAYGIGTSRSAGSELHSDGAPDAEAGGFAGAADARDGAADAGPAASGAAGTAARGAAAGAVPAPTDVCASGAVASDKATAAAIARRASGAMRDAGSG